VPSKTAKFNNVQEVHSLKEQFEVQQFEVPMALIKSIAEIILQKTTMEIT
jgi:hypothetical protein